MWYCRGSRSWLGPFPYWNSSRTQSPKYRPWHKRLLWPNRHVDLQKYALRIISSYPNSNFFTRNSRYIGHKTHQYNFPYYTYLYFPEYAYHTSKTRFWWVLQNSIRWSKQGKTIAKRGKRQNRTSHWTKQAYITYRKTTVCKKRLVQLSLKQQHWKQIDEAIGDACKTWKLVRWIKNRTTPYQTFTLYMKQ